MSLPQQRLTVPPPHLPSWSTPIGVNAIMEPPFAYTLKQVVDIHFGSFSTNGAVIGSTHRVISICA